MPICHYELLIVMLKGDRIWTLYRMKRFDFIGDQEKYRFSKDGKKRIYYVSSSKKEVILKSLNRLGINAAYIYPEIDDVAAYIKNSMQ